eukprot:tig00000430_g609.t1
MAGASAICLVLVPTSVRRGAHTRPALSAAWAARGFSTTAAFSRTSLPQIKNEPFLHYAPGSAERKALREALDQMKAGGPCKIPVVINGKEIHTDDVQQQVMPSNHRHVLAHFSQANEKLLKEAVEGALRAKAKWEAMSFDDRATIFLKAADLAAGKYRQQLNAATMLGQGKNVWQAEIDAPVETIDFWRFSAKFAEQIYQQQPPENSPGVWNRMEYRPLEGFVAAVSPFNFTAIGANLPSSPAIMGNVCLWKPSSTATLSNWVIYQILREAGLPDGVIQFVPAPGPLFGDVCVSSPHLAGLHFTGSTATFMKLYKMVAANLENYKTFPRIVGETGGKNFHMVHRSADPAQVALHSLRSAFEYQGQKCSALSRLYCPDNLWPEVRERLVAELKQVKMGPVEDFSVFMSAVIDDRSFGKIKKYIDNAKADPSCEIIAGGKCDDSVGYFVEPTVILTKDPNYVTMREEIFGPVLTVYVYPADQYEQTLDLVDRTSGYALTGSVFSRDREALVQGYTRLVHAAGNFYINDKCTGSIVGQQPFGGARLSGTNDKSGSMLNLLRWRATPPPDMFNMLS